MRYMCLLCGRAGFTEKTPHNCKGGYRKRGINWQIIPEDSKPEEKDFGRYVDGATD